MTIPHKKQQVNIQDIIPDREIIQMKNEEFAGLEYEFWEVSLPVFSDQVETLLENGFMVSMVRENRITVNRQLNPSPEKLHENKQFWKQFNEALNQC